MLADVRLGLALWVGLIGQNGIRIPESMAPLFGAGCLAVIIFFFRGRGWIPPSPSLGQPGRHALAGIMRGIVVSTPFIPG